MVEVSGLTRSKGSVSQAGKSATASGPTKAARSWARRSASRHRRGHHEQRSPAAQAAQAGQDEGRGGLGHGQDTGAGGGGVGYGGLVQEQRGERAQAHRFRLATPRSPLRRAA